MSRVRLFISSPGDLAGERQRALAVAQRLQQEFSALNLECVGWDRDGEETGPVAGAGDFDIFTTIVGSQLGTKPGLEVIGDVAAGASATELELESARASYQNCRRPELLVYRKTVASAGDKTAQATSVAAFFDSWFLSAADQTSTAAYHSFASAEQFEDLFAVHLRKLLRRFLPRPNNLPRDATSFVGREALVREVSGLLTQSEVRLVSLVGAGGTGKSRVGLQVARGLLPEFPDGAFLVTLASLRYADYVPATIAAILDIKQHDNRPVIDSVVDELRNREMLLLLDNMEQEQSAVNHLNTLLSMCPGLKILLTGREAIRASGARTVAVPPFGLPQSGKLAFSDIRDSESVQLFVQRARAGRPDFELSEENCREVLAICQRVDGVPLAIELVASRMRSMDLAGLAASMEQRVQSGSGDEDALTEHQRSLREMISWSYDLLTPEEQVLWRRFAVFTGGFSLAAAEQVCDPAGEFVVDLEVEGLVDKSLVNLSYHPGADEEEEVRGRMLDTLREFALWKLQQEGEQALYLERFCNWVVELAENSFEALRGAYSDQQLGLLEREQLNLQAAIEHCRSGEQPDWDRILKIGSGVWFYWFERGMLSSSRELFESALQDLPGVDECARARSLRALGAVARFQNDLEVAEQACHAGLELYTRLHDEGGQANVLGELGAIAQRQGKMDKAAEYLDKALQLFESAPDDLHGRSFAAAARGVINHLEGDLSGARRFYESALDTGSRSGDTDSIACALLNLGEVGEAEGDFDQACDNYSGSLEMFAQRGKKVAIAYCAEIIAGLSCKHRDKPSDAALMFGFADALREEIQSPIESFNAERLQADIQATRDAMTPETFQASWDAGSSLDIEDFLVLIRQMEISQ